MRNLQWPELLLILVVLVLLFGAKKLPDVSRSLGKSMRIFKSEVKQMQEDDKPAQQAQPNPPAASSPPPIEGTVHRADEAPRQAVPEAERRDTP